MNTFDRKQWFFDVGNGAGDLCVVPLRLRDGTKANRRRNHGIAVARAKKVLPDVPPFKVLQSYRITGEKK